MKPRQGHFDKVGDSVAELIQAIGVPPEREKAIHNLVEEHLTDYFKALNDKIGEARAIYGDDDDEAISEYVDVQEMRAESLETLWDAVDNIDELFALGVYFGGLTAMKENDLIEKELAISSLTRYLQMFQKVVTYCMSQGYEDVVDFIKEMLQEEIMELIKEKIGARDSKGRRKSLIIPRHLEDHPDVVALMDYLKSKGMDEMKDLGMMKASVINIDGKDDELMTLLGKVEELVDDYCDGDEDQFEVATPIAGQDLRDLGLSDFNDLFDVFD